MKKLLSLVLCISILMACLTICSSALSFTSPYTQLDLYEINNEISYMNEVREKMLLPNAEFSSAVVSNPIKTYSLTENGLTYNSDFIPVKINGELVSWVIKYVYEGETFFQGSVAFVEEINSIIDNDTEFALIYASSGLYLCTENSIVKLNDSIDSSNNRLSLNSFNDLDLNDIEFNSIEQSYSTNINNISNTLSRQTRAGTYIYARVGYESQGLFDKLCWAACSASLYNYYYNDISHDYLSVARAYLPYQEYDTDYNIPLSTVSEFEDVFQELGITGFDARTSVPRESIIYNNISNGNPVIAIYMIDSQASHAVVVDGINIIAGKINIMDPWVGWASATVDSGNYNYYAANLGATFNFAAGVCRSW